MKNKLDNPLAAEWEEHLEQLREFQKLPVISEYDKKQMIFNAVYNLTKQEVFYGGLLQELVIKYDATIPTLCISYNTKESHYQIDINPWFFSKCTPQNRVAVLQHEILHFTNKHIFRFPFLKNTKTEQEMRIDNIAADLAINQYIKDLPNGCELCKDVKIKSREEWKSLHSTKELENACVGRCLDIKDWVKDDGTPFPTLRSTEEYDSLIKEEFKKQSDKDGKPKPEEGSEESKGMNEGAGPQPGDTTKGTVAQNMKHHKPHDEHRWDSLDEETKKKMLDEAKKIIKRTIEKTSFSHTKVPDSIKDLLQEIDTLSAGLNYKSILKSVIKKTVSCVDRESTWKKPNRRYGVFSPGTKIGQLPALSFYLDTSGSISLKELNLFLKIMSGFLQVGSRHCWLGLWHTNLYYKKKYKLNQELKQDEVQSGGTDPTEALQDIKKTNPNLSVILTDGYYDNVDIKIIGEVLFIISEGGNKNHPLKHLGKTIPIESLK